MITLDILAFGIAKDIFGKQIYSLEVNTPINIKALKENLIAQFPAFKTLASLKTRDIQ